MVTMKYFILFILLILLLLFARYLFIKVKLNKSFLLFINRVNDFINSNNFVVSKIIEFNRFFKYKGKKIPLGSILFDDLNKQLIIYETFIYKDKNIICIPDIRLFKYNDINKCIVNDDFSKIYIESTNEVFCINSFSVNDIDIFKKIYNEIVLILNNKKIR